MTSRPLPDQFLLGADRHDDGKTNTKEDCSMKPEADDALSLFFKCLLKEAGGLSLPVSSEVALTDDSSSISSISIFQDSLKSFDRSFSHSFRRAKREEKGRRRSHPVDPKLMSRWESYPSSNNAGSQRLKCKPRRRLSPTPTSIAETDSSPVNAGCLSLVKKSIREALRQVDQVLVGDSLHGGNTTPDHFSESKNDFAPRIPSRISRETYGEDRLLAPAGGDETASVVSSQSPPRRPRRQASLTDMSRAPLELKDSQAAVTGKQSQRRHSDTIVASPCKSRLPSRHSFPSIDYGAILDFPNEDDVNGLDLSLLEAWHGVGARTA